MDEQREPNRRGLRGRHPAADRLNLIRVMPAQGWVARNAPRGRRNSSGSTNVPHDITSIGAKRDVVVPMRRSRTHGDGERALDAIIVGGGTIGLACAWRAARRGLRVRVLERDAPGAGATHVAAGMLAPVGEANWGEDALVRIALASARDWPGFAAELERESGLPSGYESRGALHVALDRDEAEELRRRYELMASLDLGVEWLRPSGCRDLEPGLSPSVAAGVHLPGEAAVDPRLLVPALVAALEECGGEILVESEVVEALFEGERLAGVVTADGREHRADRVVLASGAWSGASAWLPAPARPPVRPVKGQLLVLRGNAEQTVSERVVSTERVYLVPRPDGRLIVGATVEERGFDLQVTAGGVHELLREAYRTLPDVAELELVETLAGLRPGTPDNVPLIGPGTVDGLLVATGHFRNGILLTPGTAEIIAATLAGEQPPPEAQLAHPGRFGADSAPGLAAAPAGEEVTT
jgi:glycine oxidase